MTEEQYNEFYKEIGRYFPVNGIQIFPESNIRYISLTIFLRLLERIIDIGCGKGYLL